MTGPFDELIGRMTRETTMTVEQFDETRAERFGRPEDIVREIFPGSIVIQTVCAACGGEVATNAGGFPQHVDIDAAMKCGLVPGVSLREAKS